MSLLLYDLFPVYSFIFPEKNKNNIALYPLTSLRSQANVYLKQYIFQRLRDQRKSVGFCEGI